MGTPLPHGHRWGVFVFRRPQISLDFFVLPSLQTRPPWRFLPSLIITDVHRSGLLIRSQGKRRQIHRKVGGVNFGSYPSSLAYPETQSHSSLYSTFHSSPPYPCLHTSMFPFNLSTQTPQFCSSSPETVALLKGTPQPCLREPTPPFPPTVTGSEEDRTPTDRPVWPLKKMGSSHPMWDWPGMHFPSIL